MWKTLENDEYEASTPAVQAHFHALRTEDALRRDDVVVAEREGRLASEKFLLAANSISNQRTVDALLLLAENYEYRAKQAKARIPQPVELQGEKGGGNPQARGPQGNKDAHTDPSARRNAGEGGVQDPFSKAREDTASAATSATGKTTRSTEIEDTRDPAASAAAETQLNLAAAEMEELWRKLQEIGLTGAGSSDTTNLLMSSRHLSSSLGDSFCLLPAKSNKTSIGVHATAIDGGSTLRAAVASRMRNQRVRLMEQQYGPRGIIDDRFHKQRSSSSSKPGGTPYNPSGSEGGASNVYAAHASPDRRTSIGGGGSGNSGGSQQQQHAADIEGFQETISQQKYEIVRLLNTVKTLSGENTKLLKKCDTLSNVQEENKVLQESMEKFKVHYNQKLVMIKRALEEWRRQRNNSSSSNDADRGAMQSPGPDTSTQYVPECNLSLMEQCGAREEAQAAGTADRTAFRGNENQGLHLIVECLDRNPSFTDPLALILPLFQDDQLAKYEKWYKTLKAGAKAKQRNQNGANGSSSSTSSIGSSSGSLASDGFNSATIGSSVPRDSFTNSSSFHDYGIGGEDAAGNANGGRPPAHPNRRAL